MTPYVEVNLLQGFADASSINVSGFNFGTGQFGTADCKYAAARLGC